ncbi:restriction endonuclease subunit S [Enterococcus faecalis]|uniref:restriction endonuclease subunit S n=1 Tax=Enterococcus faecalis TaxID=1351 RepID=UPI000CF239AF|nr:restriction endonuclease subunit S [Enterococcus faecalis]EGO8077057.1 restriction endonuclease subunit S [Enterococcus faecalis]EGO8156630.1 restriction endonuclease subunit S [Enterococcus faecalis]EHH1606388.1 restriction endonuclease subunit S [Enterococcus faecalis]EIB6530397.1 restriction endonuclease subunit S [Enterococcus faecalis]EIQ7098193.1 restriction endonuclease subunit S [Enterococcus faecalis]
MVRKKIEDLGKVISGGTPSTKNERYWGGDIAWITPKDLSKHDSMFIFKGERGITEEGLKNSSAYTVPTGTVLFSSRAPIGYVAIAGKNLTTNQGFKNIVVNDENDNLFIYYLLKNNIKFIESHANGSTFKEISAKVFKNLEFDVPNLDTQRKISKILSTLDSKIELNNQIISNLEELASTLFKRWFVDFEFPDENGNLYKSSGGKMVDSELGEIPEGWEIIKLSDLVVQIKETFNPNKTEVEKVNHFSIPNFDSKKFPVIENVNTIKSNKTKITDFTVLFSKMNPNFERVWLTELNKSYLNVCSPEFIALDCKNINLQTYTYFLCKSTAFNRFLVNNATGSTGSRQRIKPSIAMGFKFVGAVDLINQYGEICSGISEQIMNLRNQIENLEEMRDALLPKLLSGEIELPEDEEM